MINPFLVYPPTKRLIVDRLDNDSWIASFPGLPKVGATAKHPLSALQNLIVRAGDPTLKLDALQPVQEETGKDRLVFEIPRTDWRPRLLAN